MKAGRLRHRVTIFSVNQATGAETDVATVWAEVDVATSQGEELESGQQTEPDTVTIRYRAGILPLMRLRFGSRRFEIKGVTDRWGRKRELSLQVKELAS